MDQGVDYCRGVNRIQFVDPSFPNCHQPLLALKVAEGSVNLRFGQMELFTYIKSREL